MKIVYASRTGNVESIVNALISDNPLHLQSGTENVDYDFVLLTYTDGYGDVPTEVETFLSSNSAHLKGVIVSGDYSYGEAYCEAGDKIANEYKVECLYKVENDGTADDIINIQKLLDELS